MILQTLFAVNTGALTRYVSSSCSIAQFGSEERRALTDLSGLPVQSLRRGVSHLCKSGLAPPFLLMIVAALSIDDLVD